MNLRKVIRIAASGLIVNLACALAQPGDAAAGEISIYSGAAVGALGTHATVGGSVGRSFSRYCIAVIDTGYMPLGASTLRSYPGIVTADSRLYDINFSMHIRVPVQQRWAPYAIVGGGVMLNTYEKQVTQPGGALGFDGKSYVAFGFETGGGTRYYITENWGVRGEYRFTFSSHNISRVLGGVFYEFDGDLFFRSRHHGHRRGYGDPY